MRDIEQYERDYADNPFEPVMVQFRHRKTVESLDHYQPKSILEVGCGLVPLYRYFSSFEELVIFEPSSDFSEKARQEAPGNVVVVNDELCDAYQPQYQQHFDLIVISSLLHELDDPLSLLRSAAHFANPGGIIHINVPNANSLHRLLAMKMGLIESLQEKSERQIKYQQHHTFDVESLRQLVNHADLKIVSSETFFVKPFTHQQMEDLLALGFLDEKMLEGLYLLAESLPDMGAEIVMNVRVPD